MTRGIRLVFARRLRFTAVPPRAGGNPSTSKYATWLSVGKASGNTAVAPPSTLMVGSKCKYQNVLSFFFLSLFLFAHYLMKFCVWAAAPPPRPPFLNIVTAHIPLPHLVELLSQLVLPLRELLWTLFAFSRVFSKSIDFGFAFFFYFLSRKITRKSYANILFAFFTWYLTCYRFSWFSFSLLCPAFVWRFVFVSISDSWRIYGFVAACFSFSFLLRVCGRGTVNGSDFNEFYWLNPYPNEVYIFSCAPAVIYQVEG